MNISQPKLRSKKFDDDDDDYDDNNNNNNNNNDNNNNNSNNNMAQYCINHKYVLHNICITQIKFCRQNLVKVVKVDQIIRLLLKFITLVSIPESTHMIFRCPKNTPVLASSSHGWYAKNGVRIVSIMSWM